MAATKEQIVSYLLTVTDAQSEYGKRLAKYCKMGRSNLKVEFIKLTLLSYYIKSLEKYFDSTDYTINNFFTMDQANDIMERINKICSTFIYLNRPSEITTGMSLIYSGSIYYRRRASDDFLHIDYSSDYGQTWELDLVIIESDEDMIIATIDTNPVGYRQVVRGGAYCIDQVLTIIGFNGVENTDWENLYKLER